MFGFGGGVHLCLVLAADREGVFLIVEFSMMEFSPKILHTLLATNELQCELSN